MATNIDILNKYAGAKAEAVDFYDAWSLYWQAKKEAPESLLDFEKLLELRGIDEKNRTPENVEFCKALQRFAVNFAHSSLPKEEEKTNHALPGQNDLEQSLVPKEILQGARFLVNDKEAFGREYKRRFVGRLVDNYVNRLRQQQRLESVRVDITRLQNRIIDEAAIEPNETAFAQKTLEIVRSETDNAEAADLAQRILAETKSLDEIHALYRGDQILEKIQRALYRKEAPDVNPEIFAAVLVQQALDHPTESFEANLTNSAKTAKAIEAMTALRVEDETVGVSGTYNRDAKEAMKSFFRSCSDTGIKKTLAPVADAAISLFGPDTQYAVVEILTGKAFKNAVHDKRLEEYVLSVAPDYLPTLKTMQGEANAHLEALKIKHEHNRIVRFFSHLGSGPEETIKETVKFQATQGGFLNKLSLHNPLSFSGLLPSGSFRFGSIYRPRAEGETLLFNFWVRSKDGTMALLRRQGAWLTHAIFLRSGDLVGWAVRWGAGRASAAAARALGGWALKTAFGKVVGGLVGALGGPVGVAAGLLLGDLVGGLFGKIKGFFGGLLNAGRYGLAGKRKWHENPSSWQFAAFLVGAPLAIILFLSFQTMSMLSGAFFVTSPRNVGGQGDTKPIRYSGAVPNNPSEITLCPVAGEITQGPGEGATHKDVDAFDYACQAGAPVVATHDGYLVGNCNYDPMLGNYVRMVAKDTKGDTYFTTYAHLLDGCSDAVAQANPGTSPSPALITRGTTIGRCGSTGNSTGNHNHYQKNGGASLRESSLPKSCGGSG